VGVVRAVVVLVLERAFFVGGEVVAATTRALAGRGRDLDQISVAINQETGPAEMLQGIFLYARWLSVRLPGEIGEKPQK
jgi:hypothetical protein